MNDILNNKSLKNMPYKVPDGYFEGLKSITAGVRTTEKSAWRKPVYASMAAAAALLIAAGGFIIGKGSGDDFTLEDYIVFSDHMTNTILYEDYELYAEALTDDDIIEYLIYNNTDLEELY